MTNSVETQGEAIEFGDMESLAGDVFTRPRSSETNLKILKAIATNVFCGKTIRTSLLEEEVVQLREIMEMVALILSKTYVARGDSFSLADDEALMLISDVLTHHEPSIIARNESKQIPKQLLR